MPHTTSEHILSTSANLLGFCLFVITSIHIADNAENHLVDEFTSIVALLFGISCVCSFASIRSKEQVKRERAETIAEYFFIGGLTGILAIILLIAFNFIR